MHRNLTNLAFVIGLLIVITACVCRSDRDQEPTIPAPDSSPSNTANSANSPAVNAPSPADTNAADANKAAANPGVFTVEHIAITNPKFTELDNQVRNEKLLEKAADRLNRGLMLPRNIVLRSKNCGEEDAFYDPADQSVTVCYELMDRFFHVFKNTGLTDDKAYAKMFDAVRFVFLHEIGHALIDAYKLPIAGSEEDAADRCSAFINIEELGDDGARAIFAAADEFKLDSKQPSWEKQNLSDEHPLPEQRYYNALCMIYGSNTTKYANIVSQNYLPQERAVKCEAEYQKTAESWRDLLAPWRKT